LSQVGNPVEASLWQARQFGIKVLQAMHSFAAFTPAEVVTGVVVAVVGPDGAKGIGTAA